MTRLGIYYKAAKKGGWVFRPSKSTPCECKWGDVYEYVVKNYQIDDCVVLDIGSAEGLKFIQLSKCCLFGVGVDLEKKMVDLANKNAKNVKNLRFYVMDSRRIEFPDNFFDVVTCRHAPFDLREIKRVLKKGGVFITQQVHERDKQNLKDHFGRGQNYGVASGCALKAILKRAKCLGFKKIRHQYSDLDYYFNSEKHLIYFLENTPVIPDYDLEKEKILTKNFAKKNQTKKGIRSNSVRYLVIMQK